MPHIVVEYSADLSFDLPEMLRQMHVKLGAEDSVDIKRIKTRAIPLKDTIVGDKGAAAHMVHIAIKLMPRPKDVAKRMASDLQALVRTHVPAGCAVTAEVVTLDPDTYCA